MDTAVLRLPRLETIDVARVPQARRTELERLRESRKDVKCEAMAWGFLTAVSGASAGMSIWLICEKLMKLDPCFAIFSLYCLTVFALLGTTVLLSILFILSLKKARTIRDQMTPKLAYDAERETALDQDARRLNEMMGQWNEAALLAETYDVGEAIIRPLLVQHGVLLTARSRLGKRLPATGS